jgi:hypothetical protein
MYVTSRWEDIVLKIDPFGEITVVMDFEGDGAGNDLDGPEALAIDGSGNVFVVCQISSNVFRIGPAGDVTEILDETANGTGVLSYPQDVAVDAAGNVYVAASGSDNVLKVTPAGTVTEIANVPTVWAPQGVAVDAAGNVFVTSCLNDSVIRIDPAGSTTTILGPSGDGVGNTLDWPTGIAIDAAGSVYVAGGGSHNVFRVGPGGGVTLIMDASGDGAGNILTGPYELALDDVGNLFVTGRHSNNVFQVSPGGVVTLLLGPAGDGGAQILQGPVGVDTDADGNVYVAGFDSGNAFKVGGPVLATTFCDALDGSLAQCPCGTGFADTGCDVPIPAGQGGGTTGGVQLELAAQTYVPANRATLSASGFPAGSMPTGVVLRSQNLEPNPVLFGDGLRCVGVPAVRLGTSTAIGGNSVHTFGHGSMVGGGLFNYQLWFRSTPASYCDPTAAFNLSNGRRIAW